MKSNYHYAIIFLFLISKLIKDLFTNPLPNNLFETIFIFGYLIALIGAAYYCFRYKEDKTYIFPIGMFGSIGYMLLFFLLMTGENFF
jgi:uncharacterized membrane-anchored protein